MGIWAGILGILHSAIGQCVHLRGRPWLYYVYAAKEHHSFPLRHDLFGAANYTGAVSALLLIMLLATSNDYFLQVLGTPQWKQLQRWNYAVFVLAAVTRSHTRESKNSTRLLWRRSRSALRLRLLCSSQDLSPGDRKQISRQFGASRV